MSRIQLAINVSDLQDGIEFYSRMFGVTPAKIKPGYANFEIENPPLKLVLFEVSDTEGGTLNHLGVEVETPEETMGNVIGDLNGRRAKIENLGQSGNVKTVSALVPLSEMFGYSTDLRSQTQGRGVYTMEFFMYSVCPKQVFDKLKKADN